MTASEGTPEPLDATPRAAATTAESLVAAAEEAAGLERCRKCGSLDHALIDALCPACFDRRARATARSRPSSGGGEAALGEVGPRSRDTARMVGTAGLAALALLVVGLPTWRALRGDTTPPALDVSAVALPATGEPVQGASQPTVAVRNAVSTDVLRDGDADASAAFGEGRFEEALRKFEELRASQPDNPEVLNNVGQTLVRLGRAPEAITHLQRAASLAPGDWMIRFNLAKAHGEAKQWAEAVASYRAADALAPDLYPTVFNLARALRTSGDSAAAADTYRRAAALNSSDPAPYLGLGATLEDQQQRPAAIAAYQQFLRMAPAGADAERVRERLQRLGIAEEPAGS